ncbi:MAG TPA: SWIB/MDM2 domain-containing protein [Thermoanaerobaculia bacterium]|nr:SWIB/MDM2 domain-containing protein [Thermoanaerobaculia bacterium]
MPKTEASKSSSSKKGGAKGQGLAREVQISSELAAVVGAAPMPRTEVTKKVWDYIKANGLQDKENKRMINADSKLLPIFKGKKQVSMFEMTALISKHLT